MGVKKLSVSLDERVEAKARVAAEDAGLSLSAWLSRTADKEATRVAGLKAVEEYEEEYGAIPEAEIAQADEILDRYDVGHPS